MKILYLVLAGGDTSHARDILTTRNSWVQSLPPDSSYFELYSDPNLKDAYIQGHEIWANCGAEYRDILKKTVISLQVLGTELENYDFIIRTNVSSYFDHPKVEKMLQKYLSYGHFYGGYIEEFKSSEGRIIPFISGAAVFWNPNTARIISKLNPDDYPIPDDVAFSTLMKKHRIKATFLPRGNICSHGFFTIAPYYRLKSSIHSELAGIRIENYHNFTLEKNIVKKLRIFLRHQKTELAYIDLHELNSYFARCWQVLKITLKYRVGKANTLSIEN